MKRISLLLLLVFSAFAAYCTTWTITNSGFTFTPETITILDGDSVRFTVANIHQPREVSESTWNANGNTQLAGGFNLPAGGGLLIPGQLHVGTHFYVCVPHASGGMKGKIIVQGSTATHEIHFPDNVSVYPNPSDGNFHLNLTNSISSNHFDLDVYNLQGIKVYSKPEEDILSGSVVDLTNLDKGIYFIKLRDGDKIYTKRVIIQ